METKTVHVDALCPKCGYFEVRLCYRGMHDSMEILCRKCGYRWCEQDYSPREVPESEIAFHAEACPACGQVVFAGTYNSPLDRLIKTCGCGKIWPAKPLDIEPRRYDLSPETPGNYWGSVRRLLEYKIRQVLEQPSPAARPGKCPKCRSSMFKNRYNPAADAVENLCEKCGYIHDAVEY